MKSHSKEILLINKNSEESKKLLGFLSNDGHKVFMLRDINKNTELVTNKKYDLCIVSSEVLQRRGYEITDRLKSNNPKMPIVFITSKNLPKGGGFDTQKDDFILQPVNGEELILRVNTALNRTNYINMEGQQGQGSFKIGKFTFDYKNRLLMGDEERALTKKESELLKLLCQHKNNVVERNVTLNLIWGKDDYFNGRSMDVFVTRLRKYLKPDDNVQIQNVHGVGFKLVVKE